MSFPKTEWQVPTSCRSLPQDGSRVWCLPRFSFSLAVFLGPSILHLCRQSSLKSDQLGGTRAAACKKQHEDCVAYEDLTFGGSRGQDLSTDTRLLAYYTRNPHTGTRQLDATDASGRHDTAASTHGICCSKLATVAALQHRASSSTWTSAPPLEAQALLLYILTMQLGWSRVEAQAPQNGTKQHQHALVFSSVKS